MGGNHSTHVANAYPCDIWVKCDAEKSYVLASSYSVDAKSDRGGIDIAGSSQLDWHRVQTDFCRIGSRQHLRFDVPIAEGKKTVYISVFGKDGQLIANGLPRDSDNSIIVTRDGYIKDAAYGSLWKDTDGTYY